MQRKENISEELRGISGIVADISRVELFEVPQGYFEGLDGRIMERIMTMESAEGLSPVLLEARDKPAFTVPEGYFEGFALGMLARIHAMHAGEAGEELAALSPLLSGIGKKTPFRAPEGYFNESLIDMGSLLQGTNGQDEGSLSPLLAGLKDKATYQAPEGYFAGLANTVSARVKEQRTEVPVISIGRRVNERKILKYAAAAIVAGLLVTGGWLGFRKTPAMKGPIDIAQSLHNATDQEIQSYLDDQDDHSLADGAGNSVATLDFSDNDVKDLLGDVPDNELKMYLEEHSASKDAVTN